MNIGVSAIHQPYYREKCTSMSMHSQLRCFDSYLFLFIIMMIHIIWTVSVHKRVNRIRFRIFDLRTICSQQCGHC